MYSAQHRLAFVHIPKTAGTSIELFFTGHDWITHNPVDYAKLCAGKIPAAHDPHYFSRQTRVKHATQAELSAELGTEAWKDAFRFTIVRNPWSRLLSVYNHGLRDAPHCMVRPFSAWLSQRDPLDHMGQPVFREWVHDWSAFHFVARFEYIVSDFARLLAMVELPPSELPRENHGSNGHHNAAAYDDKARQIIAERCGSEIQRFHYRFADAFPPPAATGLGPRLRSLWNANVASPLLPGGLISRHPAFLR